MLGDIYLCSYATKCLYYAEKYGFGIEIDEFCTADNMDDLKVWQKKVQKYFTKVDNFVMHAPFNDLVPVSIDSKIRQVVRERFLQFFDIAHDFNITKLNFHTGYIPNTTFEEWYFNELAEFWHSLASKYKEFEFYIENTFEPNPYCLKKLADNVNLNNFALCLDIGHANCSSDFPVTEWIDVWGQSLRHMHIHNNHGVEDEHLPLGAGDIDVRHALSCIPHKVSATLECEDLKSSIEFLHALM